MDESSIVLFANFDSANMARYERLTMRSVNINSQALLNNALTTTSK